MNRLLSLIALPLVAGSLGCDMVTLDAPIGEPLSQTEKATFVGRWINDQSEVCEFKLTNDQKLVMGSMSWDGEQQRHRAKNYVIDARKVGVAIYFLSHDDSKGLGFVRIERTGESEFKAHSPDAVKFRAAVETGKLSGKVISRKNDNYTVQIRADSPLTDPVFSAEDLSAWYIDEGTPVFRRFNRVGEAE